MTRVTPAMAREVVRSEASAAFDRLQKRGFQIAELRGAYPRVRAVRDGAWSLAVDFWMALDAEGRY